MSAKLCRDLSNEVTQDVSRSLRQSIRARYDGSDGVGENKEENNQWDSVAKPLRNLLREKQRVALVDYLVTHLTIPYAILEWPHPVLKLGDSGRAIKELKQKLNATGIEPSLKVDDSFDDKTHDAVISFQQANGIQPADGVVGQATWSLLDTVRRTMRDTNDLYSHFLIDVEMNPCMMTSRIKQALQLNSAVRPKVFDEFRGKCSNQCGHRQSMAGLETE